MVCQSGTSPLNRLLARARTLRPDKVLSEEGNEPLTRYSATRSGSGRGFRFFGYFVVTRPVESGRNRAYSSCVCHFYRGISPKSQRASFIRSPLLILVAFFLSKAEQVSRVQSAQLSSSYLYLGESIMAATNVLLRDESLLMSPSPLDPRRGDASASRGLSLEKKIEALESLTGQVSNRRSRRWLNDRILMELVPRLDAQEIRGLFAPPPWGDDVPPSAFSLTNVGEWDKFRNIDMDKEANIMDSLNQSSVRQKGHVDADKTAVLTAWRRIDCRTRDALRRSFLPDLIEGYENCISHFIEEGGEGDVLELKVQDPFHRLLLHGVCEYHNLVSTTETEQIGKKAMKTTKIKWKNSDEKLSISLAHFLRMSKEGAW
ncbi:unnamed protein product [Brassica oleracea]